MSKAPDKPKETAGERANADIALDQYNMAQKVRPIRDDLFKRITDYRQEKERLAGTANVDRQMTVGNGPVNPTRSAGANVGAALDRGAALSRGAVDTGLAGEKADVGSKLALAGIARGDQKIALGGVQDLATRESQASLEKYRLDEQARAAKGTAILQGIGAATNLARGAGAADPGMSPHGVPELSANQDPGAFGPQTTPLGAGWDYNAKPIPLG